MYKLKNKQLIHLAKGKYHDGGGLYIRIKRQGKGLWTYRYSLNKTSHEMSLGTYPEVSLSEAREKLAEQKRLKLKQINPHIEFSSDFIIGYPGENNQDFKDTIDLIKKINFINSYSFIFSPRPGTVAANLKIIDKKISLERLISSLKKSTNMN